MKLVYLVPLIGTITLSGLAAEATSKTQKRVPAGGSLSITGLIRDREGHALPSVPLVLEDQEHFGTGKGYSVVTAADGSISIYNLEPGLYQLYLVQSGQSRLITVTKNGPTTIAPFITAQ